MNGAPLYTCAVAELGGSEPSVVYLIWLMPEPLPSSALSETLTGELLFHPAAFGPGESCALTAGATVSMTMPVLACEGWYAASPRASMV